MKFLFETKRLGIRPLEKDDLNSLMDIWGDEEVMKYCGGAGTEERLIKSIDNCIDVQDKRGFSPFMVILKKTKEQIGCCGFKTMERDDEVELIYHFMKEHWGKGYATEAVMGCIEYAREYLCDIKKVIAATDPENYTSKKVLQKSDFEFKGMKWFDDTQQEEPWFELVIEK